jgi:hypothetical protein
VPLQGPLVHYHLYVLLAPHLGNQGNGNTARVGDYNALLTVLKNGHLICPC